MELTRSEAYELYSAAGWAEVFSIFLMIFTTYSIFKYASITYGLIGSNFVSNQGVISLLVLGLLLPFLIASAFHKESQ